MASDAAEPSAVQDDSDKDSETNGTKQETETLSKRQRKKLLKQQQWEEQRDLRK